MRILAPDWEVAERQERGTGISTSFLGILQEKGAYRKED